MGLNSQSSTLERPVVSSALPKLVDHDIRAGVGLERGGGGRKCWNLKFRILFRVSSVVAAWTPDGRLYKRAPGSTGVIVVLTR